MKKPVIRVAPNISSNAAHYGHALLFLIACWTAKALGGRAIVRIDWQLKTSGSMHRDANKQEKRQREVGFKRIYDIAKLCGISEVIDEYGVRHSLDGIRRLPKYRVFKDKINNIPIIYDYGWDTLDDKKLYRSLLKSSPKFSRPPVGHINKKLPCLMEHTHVYMSGFPKNRIKKLKELCIKTGELPRRFNKAYCHMKMDKLLGVTHVMRGDDPHSNRICDVHEKNINKEWGDQLAQVIKIPLIFCNGQKVSASKEDGITGLFPKNSQDIENMIKTFIKPEYLKHFLPELDSKWFSTLLESNNPILDAPIWSYKELSIK
jgi:hypothetical protein